MTDPLAVLDKCQVKTGKPPYVLNGGKFAALLDELGLKNGAEIGVFRGGYSQFWCKEHPDWKMLCVDAWMEQPGYRTRYNQAAWDKFYAETKTLLAPFNCTVVRGFSMDVVQSVPDESLDFVFIDANHEFRHVADDIAEWSKKVRRGGVVSGHDFGRHRAKGELIHTWYVVTAWARAYRIPYWFVFMGDEGPIWMWVR